MRSSPPVHFKPQYPYLLDLKITNTCPFGCSYCYQSSVAGPHPKATLDGWYAIVDTIQKLKVFEVAIGGGEPTLHPKFKDLVFELDRRYIKPNFTTKNLAFFNSPEAPEILGRVGGVAFSVDTDTNLDAVFKVVREGSLRAKFNVQMIPELLRPEFVSDVLFRAAEVGVRVTFLGYKEVGRADPNAPPPVRLKDGLPVIGWKGKPELDERPRRINDNPLAAYKELDKAVESLNKLRRGYALGLPTLGVDTAFARRYQSTLKELGVPARLYHTDEGRLSMYWDLVTDTFGPSSYCPKEEMVSVDSARYGEVAELILSHFRQWGADAEPENLLDERSEYDY